MFTHAFSQRKREAREIKLHHHMGPNSKNKSFDLKQEFKEVLGVYIKDRRNIIEREQKLCIPSDLQI